MRLNSSICSIALLLTAKGIQAESITTTDESRAAYDCELKASVKCIIIDDRAELASFKGMDCLPFVKTSWIYNLCNGGDEDVQFQDWLDTHGVFFANKKTLVYDENSNEFGKGVLKAGYCQSATYDSDLNSFKRKHRTDVILKARLNRNRQLKCDARASKKIRFRYSDDCKVEANTECTLRGTDIPCNENIEYRRYGKCSEIPVTYK
ncbi:predicted protein [Chaetoceros tenuissimus]|uniref:Uncharacterized protein n=1 Tax=Chaetoceros tenuissimus TaxID=426638 RepID=A0AAD3GYR6_9STRA|nr:predicted protein [Chaetoceros tenuissimus]